jgi:Penicillin-insensitive murein endopeptidase
MAQPRGGPLPFGHRSHQIGLDVDIWFMPMPDRVLSRRERDNIVASNLVAADGKNINGKTWSPSHVAFTRTAAEQPEVERVLVNAAIKKELCRVEGNKDNVEGAPVVRARRPYPCAPEVSGWLAGLSRSASRAGRRWMRQVAQILVCRLDFAFEDPGNFLVSQRPEAQGFAPGVHYSTQCTGQSRQWGSRRTAGIAMRIGSVKRWSRPKRNLVGLWLEGQSRYNVFMWGRIIIGAVVVVLVAVWLIAIWFLIADPRVIVDSRMVLPKLPTWWKARPLLGESDMTIALRNVRLWPKADTAPD